jgi:hypothetical protein
VKTRKINEAWYRGVRIMFREMGFEVCGIPHVFEELSAAIGHIDHLMSAERVIELKRRMME